ncbi:MAG: winged helix DNA-binding domain-containing protein [Egibacteraceae bacterium]
MVIDVSRKQVLAYRVAAHELDRVTGLPSELAVLDLGVQDTPYGSARLALAARTAAPLDDGSLALVWSARGAPHLHRWADLPRLAAALWPLSDADATARIASSQIKQGARLGLAAFTATAEAMHAVVTVPLTKGEVSAAVTARVPESLTYWCRSCKARHISGGLFQQAGLPGGVRLEPGSSPTTLAPIDDWPTAPSASAGTDSLVTTYLRLLGPAAPGEAAKFLGTTQTELRRVWPGGLVEVRVDGRRTWLPEDRVDALRSAPTPRLVRLLPPSDPFLQARDRTLLLPDKTRHSALWRVLGNPGALLVDGEITGVWRARLAGRAKLEVTVTPFAPLSTHVRAAVEAEAAHVAAARGATDVCVRLDA